MRRLSFLVSLVLAGCAAPDARHVDEGVGQVGEAIAGGELDTTDTAVVGVVALGQGGIESCSGTLIAPNVVLTAHHCVANINTGAGIDCSTSKFGPTRPAGGMFVTTKTSLSQKFGDYHGTKEIDVPPGNNVCGNDVAVLVLTAPIDASEAKPRRARVDTSLVYKEPYYAVGYGKKGDTGSSGTRYRRDNLVTHCVGVSCFTPQIASAEWLGDTGVCQGDSGGPAFDLDDRVVGVASRGAAGCTQPIYTQPFGVGDWLKGVVIKATSDAGIDPPDWATGTPTDSKFHYDVGGACQQPKDCASNACIDSYCTRECNSAATCPKGYECGDNGYCQRPAGAVNDTTPAEATPPGETVITHSACSLTRGQDPTKPIPWIVSAALGFAFLRRRRR